MSKLFEIAIIIIIIIIIVIITARKFAYQLTCRCTDGSFA